MIIEKYVFDVIDSNMYVCIEDEQALIIDPFKSKTVKNRLFENGVKKVIIILTHEHIDHISGANYYEEFDSIVYAGEECKIIVEKDLRQTESTVCVYFYYGGKERKTESK